MADCLTFTLIFEGVYFTVIFSILIGATMIFLVSEIVLRLTIGFDNPLLYITDPDIGYLLAPNQQVRRFGNRVKINEHSMRSPSLLNPQPGLRVLLLGDSVLNGSWWTDQADTISEMIARIVTLELNSQITTYQTNPQQTPKQPVEILNVSANGWSPRNLLAYLQKFGSFQADILILVLNTDDLFGTAPTSVPVGSDRYYPSQKPALAILEAVTRLLPYTPPPEMEIVKAEGGDRVGLNLTALIEIHHLAQTQHIPLGIALTPLWHEVIKQPKNHEILARERLVQFTQEQDITYLDFLPIFQTYSHPKSLYRDQIHLNSAGNKLVSAEISKVIVRQTLHVKLKNKF